MVMQTLFADHAAWFTGPAILGTGFLVTQMLMGQIGGDLHVDADHPGEIDFDVDHPGDDAKWLSLQTIAAFCVGFGWIGLSVYRLTDLHFLVSALCALAAGFGTAWLIVQLSRALMRLQSDANLDMEQLVGLEAPVYITIPPRDGGTGRVTVTLHDNQHELSARQGGHDPIPTHSTVRIVGVDGASGTVVVELA